MPKIKGNINSHVQIPKCALKGFSFSDGFINEQGKPERYNYVFYIKKANLEINKIRIENANTVFGYYEDEVEEAFCKVESGFADAVDHIRNNLKQIERMGYKYIENDILAIKKYCSLCWVRSPKLVDGVYKKNQLIDLLGNQPQNVVAYTYFNDGSLVDKYFDKLNFTIIKNTSKTNYLLPQIGIIVLGDKTLTDYKVYIPITPKTLILLTTEKTVIDNKLAIRTMPEETVDKFNKKCIEVEINNNEGNIYAKRKEDIIRYIDYINTINKS